MTSRTLLRLNKANIYHSYHGMQDRDVNLVLQKYKQKMKWCNRHRILDIGCGPGDLSVNYLLPLIPKNGQMLGIDISPSMIQYANFKYKDSRIKFKVMDISKPDIGEKYRLVFNSVFSFYCLHWIQDQWNTMKNIYNVLQSGGETLLVFLASSPIYTLYEILSTSPKWSPYMHDYKDAISPYHNSTDPESEIRNLLSDIGFNVIDCFCSPMSYTMPTKETLYKSIQAVNPFLNRIPQHLLEDYNNDCKTEIMKGNLCVTSEETEEVTFSYSLMTVYAEKPKYVNE